MQTSQSSKLDAPRTSHSFDPIIMSWKLTICIQRMHVQCYSLVARLNFPLQIVSCSYIHDIDQPYCHCPICPCTIKKISTSIETKRRHIHMSDCGWTYSWSVRQSKEKAVYGCSPSLFQFSSKDLSAEVGEFSTFILVNTLIIILI